MTNVVVKNESDSSRVSSCDHQHQQTQIPPFFNCDTSSNVKSETDRNVTINNNNHLSTQQQSMQQQQQQALQDITNKRNATAREIVSIIRKGKFDEFVYLLETKPNTELLNTFVNGNTALHHCLLLGRGLSWCKELVANGANPNLSNLDGWHPIHLAAYGGHSDIVAFLIECNTRSIA